MTYSHNHNLGAIMYRDFAVQPPHSDNWYPVLSRPLTRDGELHELTDWLWNCASGRWSPITWYLPSLHQLVYFEKLRDATLFKLSWGDETDGLVIR